MSAIRAIEQAVQPLSAHELAEFRQWVIEFDEAVLDAQIEEVIVSMIN